MAIQIIQAMVGYQLMTIMVSTIKAHHLTGGSLPLATAPAAAPSSGGRRSGPPQSTATSGRPSSAGTGRWPPGP